MELRTWPYVMIEGGIYVNYIAMHVSTITKKNANAVRKTVSQEIILFL